MKKIYKYLSLFITAGLIYILGEIIGRGFSHWTMFLVAGFVFIPIGLLNKRFSWKMLLWKQMLIGAVFITAIEFIVGLIINVWLGWAVWDYSDMPFNLLGQICLHFFIVWFFISFVIIILDDWLRYWWWNEERPRYRLW